MLLVKQAVQRPLLASKHILLLSFLLTQNVLNWLLKNVSTLYLEICLPITHSSSFFLDIPLAPVLEGIVLLRKNPDYMEEDKE